MSKFKLSRGALIVLEGCDRSGKSTQAGFIVDYLRKKGFRAEKMNFPERSTQVGQVINSYLKGQIDAPDEVIHLLFSANRWEHSERIKEKLQGGISLVVDRYAHSGAAYTGAKGLDQEWCCNPDRGLPKPDLVVFLDVRPSKSAERSGFGNERYENIVFQQDVYKAYERLLFSPKHCEQHGGEVWSIDSDQMTEKCLAEGLAAKLDKVVHACKSGKDIQPLWLSPWDESSGAGYRRIFVTGCVYVLFFFAAVIVVDYAMRYASAGF